jgi:hypothetical protein
MVTRSIGMSPVEALYGFPCRTALATAGANPQLARVAEGLG